jgi:hypothetical protein
MAVAGVPDGDRVVTCGAGSSAEGTIGAPRSAATTMAVAVATAAVNVKASRRTYRRRLPVTSTKTGLSADEPGNPVSVIPHSTLAVSTYWVAIDHRTVLSLILDGPVSSAARPPASGLAVGDTLSGVIILASRRWLA